MTDGITSSPRFNPARAEAQRIRIEPGKPSSGSGTLFGWFSMLILVVAGCGAILWAQQAGHIQWPWVNELLAKTNLRIPGFGAPAEALIEPGAEPLVPLRYVWSDGASFERTVTVELERSVTIGDETGEGLVLGLDARVRAELGDETENGRFWSLSIESLTASGSTASASEAPTDLADQLEAARSGFRGALLVDERGQALQSRLAFPETSPELAPLLDQLVQTLALCVPTFPEAPIGVGGRWRTRLEAIESGAALEVDHTLAANETSGTSIESTLSSGAGLPADLRIPGLAEDVGELRSYGAMGTLSRTLELNGIVSTLEGETTTEARFERAGAETGPVETLVVTTYRSSVR